MLSRFLQKIFGENGPTGEFGQFGSDNAGSQVTTKDPDEIQGLDAYYGQGLFPATKNHQEPPRIEDINGLYFLFTRQLAYLFQAGIAEWQTDTEYFAEKSIVLASDGGIYIAITGTSESPNTGLEPSTHGDNWKLLITKSGVASGNPPLTRAINPGNGLSGGGDLSADRTLALDFEATATNIKMDGAQSVGTTTKAARSDHVHPTDTSRAPTVHASSGTTYGVGTTANYGHNKVINDLTHSSFANGESLSAYQGYVLANKSNVFPVGFSYIQLKGFDSPSDLGLLGTWTDVTANYANRYLAAAGSRFAYGTDYDDGLPNITGDIEGLSQHLNNAGDPVQECSAAGAFGLYQNQKRFDHGIPNNGKYCNGYGANFYASRSSSIYGAASFVRPATSVIKIWQRTA